jgi:hypothetical protein
MDAWMEVFIIPPVMEKRSISPMDAWMEVVYYTSGHEEKKYSMVCLFIFE